MNNRLQHFMKYGSVIEISDIEVRNYNWNKQNKEKEIVHSNIMEVK